MGIYAQKRTAIKLSNVNLIPLREKLTKVRSPLQKYIGNPIGFIEDFLGESLTTEQKLICESVVKNRETNVPAAHSVGKSFLSAKLIIYWVFCVQGLAISTAPTDRQVDKILWGELRRTYDKHKKKLGGVRGVKFLKLNESANAFGFTARDNNSDAFQGIHHPNLLIIEDEANGISQEIDDAAKSCASGTNNRILRTGNPLTPGSAFNLACRRSQIRIPVWNHPNVAWAYDINHKLKPEIAALILDEDGNVKSQNDWPVNLPRDVIPGAVSVQWIEEARTNGEESPYWLARVNALFPTDATDGIIPYSWLERARQRYDESPDKWDELVLDSFWYVGVDVGDGDDYHAITVRRGCVFYSVKTYPTKGDEQDVIRLAGYVTETCKEILKKDWETLKRFNRISGEYVELSGNELITEINKKIKINVDNIGVGSGTLGTLKNNGIKAYSCKVGRASTRPDEFINLNIQIYWQLRLNLQAGIIAIAPLGRIEHQVFEDLAAIKYETTPRGVLKCEDKEKARKLLGRSPDAGNSFMLCSWEKKVVKADFGTE